MASTNQSPEYKNAEAGFLMASTDEEKLSYLEEMIRTAPKHKSSEKMLANLKKRYVKLKEKIENEKKKRRRGSTGISVKKEGAAQIVILGMANSGKSTLLRELTNANVAISEFPFTTKKPEIGILDYHGAKLQLVEIPAIVRNFEETENGAAFLGIIRQADAALLLFKDESQETLVRNELKKAGINIPFVVYANQDKEGIGKGIWSKLNLIKIFTKQPHQKPDYPPIVLKKGSSVKDLAKKVHKDFVKKFKFARVYGKSVKFDGIKVGLNHVMEDDDIVELHTK